MIDGFWRSSARALNFAKFYGGVAVKAANRRKVRYARTLLRDCKQDRARLDSLQLEKLNALLSYANHNVDYYHELFRSIGLVTSRNEVVAFRNLAELNGIPCLDKEILRREGPRLHSREHERRGSYTSTSGGSTGEKAFFLQDNAYRERATANFRLARRLMGIPFHANDSVLLWAAVDDIGRPVMPANGIDVFFKNAIILNSCKMTEQDMRAVLRVADRKRPTFIRGYSQSLHEIASFATQESISVHPQNAVISTATSLSEDTRRLVESVFGCKVFDYYGSREVAAIATECRAHDGLHILEDNNHLEVVDESGRNVGAGQVGEIVLTNLNNYSMPLLRYKIGDRAETANDQKRCPCGCNYAKIERVVGRTVDVFILRNGDKVDGTYLTLLMNSIETSIERFQIIQRDYDLVEFVIQSEQQLRDSETTRIEAQLRESMGQACTIKWKYTPRIEPGPTGKFRFVISDLQ